ncbi:MAG: hypothetical protein AAFO74_09150 [Pseudomonadota bacterium]
MTSDLAAALARYWPLLISLILEVSGQVAAPGAWTRARQAKLFARLRGAEALARRWLMLKSTPCFRAAPAQRCTTGSVSRVCPAAPRPERAPLLRFLERDPALRAADFSGQPFARAEAPASNGPPVDTALAGPSAGLLRRTEALLDVLRRPDHHAARMTRWLRRAAARRGFVRGAIPYGSAGRPGPSAGDGRGAALNCSPPSGGSTAWPARNLPPPSPPPARGCRSVRALLIRTGKRRRPRAGGGGEVISVVRRGSSF